MRFANKHRVGFNTMHAALIGRFTPNAIPPVGTVCTGTGPESAKLRSRNPTFRVSKAVSNRLFISVGRRGSTIDLAVRPKPARRSRQSSRNAM